MTLEEAKMRFKIVECDTDHDVLGGAISGDNPYVSSYPNCERDPFTLAVGEHTVARFSLSGSKGTYWIVRVE